MKNDKETLISSRMCKPRSTTVGQPQKCMFLYISKGDQTAFSLISGSGQEEEEL